MKMLSKCLISTITMSTLLVGCGSKLPDPTPLADFPSTAHTQKVWSTSANDGNEELFFKLTPAWDETLIYSAGYEGDVSAINLMTGKKVWKQHYKDLQFSSNLAVTTHELYLGTDNAQIVKLDKVTGQLIWTKPVSSTVIAAPKASNNEVFAKNYPQDINIIGVSDYRSITVPI